MDTTEHEKIKESDNTSVSLPNAVILAGFLIAGAILMTGNGGATSVQNRQSGLPPKATGTTAVTDQTNLNKINPVSANEHVRGNPNAPVKIVEYSDLECPFCKQFHATLQQAMSEYGANGQIAWIYRQYPITSLHPKAEKEAEASECASELGGNDVFWKYVDRVYEVTTSNNTLDPAELPIIAQYVGLNVSDFNACLSSGKYAQKIAQDTKNAQETGGNGTPWSIVVASSGQKFPVNGAVPYSTLKQTIDQALQVK